MQEPNKTKQTGVLSSHVVNRRFCVAPMLNWTDKHCRYFHRLLSQHVLLYTEMVTTGALLRGDAQRFLQFNQQEHPLALQLGGSNPLDLAHCAKMAQDYGYDEVNLNVGCPSDRVQNGRFGACLMLEPHTVAECVAAMQTAVSIPITVKSRIGVDERDSYAQLCEFIQIVAQAGCETFILHARKAWLNGLSPKENREIPPLRYDVVQHIKHDFPHLEIVLNGGITDLDSAEQHLKQLDGVMLGREIYHNPYLLAQVDQRFFAHTAPPKNREEIVLELIPYLQRQREQQVQLHSISRHILGLFHAQLGARQWRRYLSDHAVQKNANEQVLLQALKFVQR